MTCGNERRILYIVPSVGIGGAETFIQHTALFHNRDRFLPIYCCLRQGPLFDWLCNQKNGTTILDPHPYSRLSRPYSVYRTINWLRAQIRHHDVSLVHSTMAYGALFGAVAAHLERIPHIWFQHGPVSGWMDQLAGSLPSERILVNSNFTLKRQESLERRFLPKRKLEMFGLGVDIEKADEIIAQEEIRQNFIQEQRNKYGIGANEFVAGILCRLQEWKGVHIFIKAIAKANQSHSVRGLVFSGTTNLEEQSQYEHRLRRLALDSNKNILFVGHTNEPLKAMAALDTIVNASITPEPFGLTLIEAMAVGRPPIAPSEGGPQDIIQDGHTGLFFAPRSSDDLANKLIRLATDKSLYSSLCINARAAARKRFSAVKSIANLENIYESIFKP